MAEMEDEEKYDERVAIVDNESFFAADSLCRAASHIFGPIGRAGLAGDGIVSGISGNVFNAMKPEPTSWRLLIDMSGKTQWNKWGDGGLLSLFVACKLLTEFQKRATDCSNACRAVFMRAYNEALSVCETLLSPSNDLEEPSARVTCMRLESLDIEFILAFIRPVVFSKQLALTTNMEKERVCASIARSFLEAGGEPRALRTLRIIGQSPGESRSFRGVFLDAMCLPFFSRSLLPRTRGNRVALFAIPIDESGHDWEHEHLWADARVDCEDAHAYAERCRSRLHSSGLFDRLVDRLVSSGVNVVICQKTIDQSVKSRLLESGVVPIERISLTHLSAVKAVTGAHPITSLENFVPLDSVMGSVQSISMLRLGHRELVHLKPAHGEFSTLALMSYDEASAAELETLAGCALRTLRNVWSLPLFASPGCGCVEMLLSEQIRKRGQRSGKHGLWTRKEAYMYADAVDAFATSLEETVKQLTPASMEPEHAMLLLKRHAVTWTQAGHCALQGMDACGNDVVREVCRETDGRAVGATFLESPHMKLDALRTATAAATALLHTRFRVKAT